jgi:subtilisin
VYESLIQNSPVLGGVVLALGFVWRVCQRVLNHIEQAQSANQILASQNADRLDKAEQRCVEQMAAVVDPLRPVLERNSEALGRTHAILERHERGGRWSIMSQGEVVDVDQFDVRDNPNNEPVYGIPPGEREPEMTLRDASMLEEKRDWGHRLLGIAELHDMGVRGAGVVVAILDTGVDANHPGLAGQVVSRSNHTISPTLDDRQGHGTHCAGIVAERHDTDGLVGVAPDAKLHAGKVLGDNGSGLSSGIAQGIRTATAAKVDIISMSLGGPTPDGDTRSAIDAAVAAGVWVVSAAGNEGPGEGPSFPGNYPNVVCVAAVDEAGNVARFSTRNREVDIAAPGVSVLSTYPGGRYASLSGTSMATPYVSGVLALLRGEIKKRGLPIPSLATVMEVMSRTAKDITPTGRDTASGSGLIQPKALIEAVLASLGNNPPPPPSPPSPPVTGKVVRLTHPDLVAAGVSSVNVELKPTQASRPQPAVDVGGLIDLPLGIRTALRMLMPILRRVAERTQTQVDDLLVRLAEIVFGFARSASAAATFANESDWWKAAQEIIRQLLPILKQLASRTGTNLDDIVLDIVERLLSMRTSAAALSSGELSEKARRYAAEAGLVNGPRRIAA